MLQQPLSRRAFVASLGSLALSSSALASLARLPAPVKIGFIADLHHDLMHDSLDRMNAFTAAMKQANPDAVIQMGDFAYPKEANRPVIEAFNSANKVALHVLGNHDTDAKHTVQQCEKIWGLTAPYYSREIAGLTLIVLNANERGSPRHKGGYPNFIGPKQVEWLSKTLSTGVGPVIVLSHQPLAGPYAVDNSVELQALLAKHRDRVLLSICGHTHIDYLLRVQDIPYLHVNSASYYWVGEKSSHPSYAKEIHDKHKVIASTCPYKDSLYTLLSIDPKTLSIKVSGRTSEWVGPSPVEVKADLPAMLTDGEEVAPRIRERSINRKPR